jgi:hypothetical protein
MVTAYETNYSSRLSDGSQRPAITQTLEQMDKQLDDAVKEVKVYIQKKFKKANAEAQYARYGIIHSNASYNLPNDRDNRKTNLDLMIAAIAADGFGAEEFGTTFWTTMKTNYALALTNAGSTDSNVSKGASGKNEQKKNITNVMNALRLVLRGNYPDTYTSVYRQWGWQKEDY